MVRLIENSNPLLAAAKGKGCSTRISFPAPEKDYSVFLGGVGVASLSRFAEDQPADLADLNARGLVAMEWLSNRMFGKHEELGELEARFKVPPEGKNRSTAMVIADKSKSLLPGRIVN